MMSMRILFTLILNSLSQHQEIQPIDCYNLPN